MCGRTLKRCKFVQSEDSLKAYVPNQCSTLALSDKNAVSDGCKTRFENLLQKSDNFESGQMVLKKVKWECSGVYLSQTMWNHAKNSTIKLKRPTLVF